MSIPALNALAELVTSKGIPFDPQAKEQLTANGEPPVEQVTALLKTALEATQTASDTIQELVTQIPVLCKKYPAADADEGRLPEGAKVIEDPRAVKTELTLSEIPKPSREWNDLPISRL